MKVKINDIDYDISLGSEWDNGSSECAQTAKPITKGKNNFKVKSDYWEAVLFNSVYMDAVTFQLHFEYKRFYSAHQAKVYLKQFKIRCI